MARNVILALVVAVVCGNRLIAADGQAPPKSGDLVGVMMTGDVAKEYTVRQGLRHVDGSQISTVVKITKVLASGQLRIEQSLPVKRDGKPEQLLTFEAVVDQKNITIHVTPKGTAIYASPGDHKKVKPQVTTEETSFREVNLSKLEGIKLRTWTLTDELIK